MKAKGSSAAVSSHTCAWRGLSAVAFASASRRSRLAASTSACADASVASLVLQKELSFGLGKCLPLHETRRPECIAFGLRTGCLGDGQDEGGCHRISIAL